MTRIHGRDREFAAFLLSRSGYDAARVIAPATDHPGLSATDGEVLLAELIMSIPPEHVDRPLSYLHGVLAGDASTVRGALRDHGGASVLLDDRRLTNALLHVSLCLVLKIGEAEADPPRLSGRLAGIMHAVRAAIGRLKAYG